MRVRHTDSEATSCLGVIRPYQNVGKRGVLDGLSVSPSFLGDVVRLDFYESSPGKETLGGRTQASREGLLWSIWSSQFRHKFSNVPRPCHPRLSLLLLLLSIPPPNF
jgi:hypothetical protein